MAFCTASLVGKAGIAPLSITVSAQQALANLRASLSKSSFYNLKTMDHQPIIKVQRYYTVVEGETLIM